MTTQNDRFLQVARDANKVLEAELNQAGIGRGWPVLISPTSGRWIPGRGRGSIGPKEVGLDGYFDVEAPAGQRFTLGEINE